MKQSNNNSNVEMKADVAENVYDFDHFKCDVDLTLAQLDRHIDRIPDGNGPFSCFTGESQLAKDKHRISLVLKNLEGKTVKEHDSMVSLLASLKILKDILSTYSNDIRINQYIPQNLGMLINYAEKWVVDDKEKKQYMHLQLNFNANNPQHIFKVIEDNADLIQRNNTLMKLNNDYMKNTSKLLNKVIHLESVKQNLAQALNKSKQDNRVKNSENRVLKKKNTALEKENKQKDRQINDLESLNRYLLDKTEKLDQQVIKFKNAQHNRQSMTGKNQPRLFSHTSADHYSYRPISDMLERTSLYEHRK